MFFHFDSRILDNTRQTDAFRAITNQLIHQQQNARDIIDTASILMDVTGSGHPRASDDEVLEMLSLLIRRLPGIVMVFDGVDECVNASRLLRTIHEVANCSTCKVLVLGRPNITFPQAYKTRWRIDPKLGSNLNDIRLYLMSEVGSLLEEVTIAGHLSRVEIANIIADRCGSMFLFAKLMVGYLQSPALSSTQRLEEIRNLTLVEGLESMYERVIRSLTTRFAKEKDVVYHIFRFLVVAACPLKITEIRTILSMTPGKGTEDRNCIENLESSIPLMCEALVEVSMNGTVRFVHSSVKEFLISSAEREKSGFFYIECERKPSPDREISPFISSARHASLSSKWQCRRAS